MGKISYNCLSIPDKGQMLVHLLKAQPKAILFYQNEIDFARIVKKSLPECEVIIRMWPDATIHKDYTPKQWLDRNAPLAAGGLMLYTTNEPGFTKALIEWHIDLAHLAIDRGIKLCMLNLGVGQPGPDEWHLAQPLLELIASHPNLFALGLHEYAGGVFASGVVGSTPVDTKFHADFTIRDNWKAEHVIGQTMWHMGRWHFLKAFLKKVGIPMLRIIVTEWGFDYTGDIGAWLNSLPPTQEYTSNNGWKSLVDDWKRWWPDWDAQTAMSKQLALAEQWMYEDVEAMLLFCYGTDGNWDTYRVDNFIESFVEQANPVVLPPEPPKPPEVPSTPIPIDRGIPQAVKIQSTYGYVNVYNSPQLISKNITARILHGEDVTMFPKTGTAADGLMWYWTEVGVRKGWVAYNLPPTNTLSKRVTMVLPGDMPDDQVESLRSAMSTLLNAFLTGHTSLMKASVIIEG